MKEEVITKWLKRNEEMCFPMDSGIINVFTSEVGLMGLIVVRGNKCYVPTFNTGVNITQDSWIYFKKLKDGNMLCRNNADHSIGIKLSILQYSTK